MCGRFVLHNTPRYLASVFGARYEEVLDGEWQPSWNVAPTTPVLGIAAPTGERVLSSYRWGLVPYWAKELSIGDRAFNARAETAASRPMYRAAFRSHRLIVPADGFYEWSRHEGPRPQPYFFSRADGAPLALAGLFEEWRPGPGVRPLRSCTVLTTAAGPDLADIHEREPVVLAPDAIEVWLDRANTDRDELESLLHPGAAGTLSRWRVDRGVGRSSSNGPQLIEPVTS